MTEKKVSQNLFHPTPDSYFLVMTTSTFEAVSSGILLYIPK